jgi:hypothetical protein
MRQAWTLSFAILYLLSACGASPNSKIDVSTTPGSSPVLLCGNGICESGENSSSCQQDCPETSFSGNIQTTYIKSDGSGGNIAVMVASPTTKRFNNGAGVIVVIPPLFSSVEGFMKDPDLTSLGLVQVSYLWPGDKDTEEEVKSDGEFDHGGANSIKILRDVIRFAGGRLEDVNGRYIYGLTTVPPLTEEVGMYAFGDGGMAAVKALSLYGDQFQGLQYYVGRENPTIDLLACEEVGYYDVTGKPVYNPFYIYPASYSFNTLSQNYTNLRWDPTYTSNFSAMAGRPYFDLDGNGRISASDYVFDGQPPVIDGKRYYSIDLTQALLSTGALSEATWPADVATLDEVTPFWNFLQSSGRFAAMQNDEILQNLKVMLVFAQNDHAQVALDKPHIHQAYQGFRFEAGLWVRLNPDRAYVQEMLQAKAGSGSATPTAAAPTNLYLNFPDNPANTQPDDWAKISDYAYPGQGAANRLVPLAAVAEMADRAHAGVWDENVGEALFNYIPATQSP